MIQSIEVTHSPTTSGVKAEMLKYGKAESEERRVGAVTVLGVWYYFTVKRPPFSGLGTQLRWEIGRVD